MPRAVEAMKEEVGLGARDVDDIAAAGLETFEDQIQSESDLWNLNEWAKTVAADILEQVEELDPDLRKLS